MSQARANEHLTERVWKAVKEGEWLPTATVLSPEDHPIDERDLPLEVVWIMERLRWHGFLAYIVGGGVRDLLMGKKPKDFDLGTDALPEQIARLFFNCRLIGRRFRIVHIYFRDGTTIEVSTFRQAPARGPSRQRPLVDDNLFGLPSEDAWRRDLTINGLFYDSDTREILDYVGGLDDLRQGLVRAIGPPEERFREDPVRMVRALRHAARHEMEVEPRTWKAIGRCADNIKMCSTARVYAEFTREIRGKFVHRSLPMMFESGLLDGWMPAFAGWLREPGTPRANLPRTRFGQYPTDEWGTPEGLWKTLKALDEWEGASELVPDGFWLTALMLPAGWAYVREFCEAGINTRRLWRQAFDERMKPMLREIPAVKVDIEYVNRLLHTYWRLHLASTQPALWSSLHRSPFLNEAKALVRIEAKAYDLPEPTWLDEAI